MSSSAIFSLTTLPLSLSLYFFMALVTLIDNCWELLKDGPLFCLSLWAPGLPLLNSEGSVAYQSEEKEEAECPLVSSLLTCGESTFSTDSSPHTPGPNLCGAIAAAVGQSLSLMCGPHRAFTSNFIAGTYIFLSMYCTKCLHVLTHFSLKGTFDIGISISLILQVRKLKLWSQS